MPSPHRIQTLRVLRSSDDREVVGVSEIEVTFEKIERVTENLPREVEERSRELFDGVHERPEKTIPILKDIIARYPNIPQLYNWLAAAYGFTGQVDLNNEIVIQSYQRNPEYLFARVNYAELLLQRGEVQAVPAVFGGELDLAGMYPDRRRFHITEFLGFSAILAWYLMATGKAESARYVYQSMRGLAPDHPMVEQTRLRLHLESPQ